jgi:protein TonB
VAPTASRRRRFLLIAVALSVGVHVLAALLIVLLPRVLPRDAEPKEPATVELLMVEKKGAQPSQAAPPTDSKPAQKPETPKTEPPKPEPPKPEAPKPEAPKAEVPKDEPPAPKAIPAPPLPEHGDEPSPPPAEPSPPKPAKEDPQPAPKQAEAKPSPPPAPQGPVFDFSGTESESNATVIGGHVLPAAPDDRFRNRPPIYPLEAQNRGEHGSVTLLIHVSDNGTTSGVDILESSGVDLLDQAAVAAVKKWRFHPALKQGQAVPYDYPFQFIFEPR